MSNRRNRGRNHKFRESDSAPSAPQPMSIPPETQPKTSRWKWIHDHHQAVASYAALVGVVVAIVGLYIQSSQQRDSDKQIEILQKSIQQTHLHEIAPQLVVERFEHDELVGAGDGMAAQLRNVGRGVAKNAVVRVHLFRFEGKPLEPESVISRITVAPNDTVRFRFAFPIPPDGMKGDQGMMGTIGLYCQDDEGHEVLATQLFTLNFQHDNHGRHIAPTFKTPKSHHVNVKPRTSENVRTEHDAEEIIDHLVTQEHERLRKFGQTNRLPTSVE